MKQEFVPAMRAFKKVMTEQPTADALRLKQQLAGPVFGGDTGWTTRPDDWVAERVSDWADRGEKGNTAAVQAFAFLLGANGSAAGEARFVELFAGLAKNWRARAEPAGGDKATAKPTAATDADLQKQAEQLRKEIAEVYLQTIKDTTQVLVQMLDHIKKYEELEFVRSTVGIADFGFLLHRSALKDLGKAMVQHEAALGAAVKELQDSAAAGKPRLEKAVAAAALALKKYLADRGELARATNAVQGRMTATITGKMLDAHAFGEVHEIRKNIKEAQAVAGFGLQLTETLAKSSVHIGTFVRLGEFLSVLVGKVDTELAVRKAENAFDREKPTVALFQAFDAKPELLYKRMQANQRVALELFVSALGTTLSGALSVVPGAGEIGMAVFDGLSGLVTAAVDGYLAKRADLAMEAIKKLGDSKYKDQEKAGNEGFWADAGALWDAGLQSAGDVVKANLVDGIDKLVQQEAPDHLEIAGLLQQWAVPPVTKFVLRFIQIKPAEFFTGEQLAKKISDINLAILPPNITVAAPGANKVAPPVPVRREGGMPKTVKDCPVIATDRNRSRVDGDPRTHVVRVALQLKSGDKIWGDWAPHTDTWEAVSPYEFADWSRISLDGKTQISLGATKLTGSWHGVLGQDGVVSVGFKTAGGRWLMGHRGDKVQGGPSGANYLLGAQTEKFWGQPKDIRNLFRI
ncbi:hypothetical protein [Kitasatospora viridis]|uniref:Uncharacterized protein n=1 Tax=Kitasatospora viridis TaxID=281105 RepID=A0A561TV68_9ACTN|nr:hypothetical protein [Kitasatospora viridis]TWF90995.1 hypothetical protein FHX73_12107 [Kitasatospora viridis]